MSTVKIADIPSWHEGRQVSPSKAIADRFEGIEIRDDDSEESARKAINGYIELTSAIYRMGWYDHTADWDFHVGVVLKDGRRNDHIGDGADVTWLKDGEPDDDDSQHSGSDVRTHIGIGENFFNDPEVADELKEFRVDEDFDGYSYAIPFNLIRSLTFGYCT